MSLIDPRLNAALARFFPHRCTFKQMDGAYQSGSDTAYTYPDVPGLVSLQAAYGASPSGPPGKFEVEGPAQDRILLLGYYPQITPNMRCVLELHDQAGNSLGQLWFSVSDAVPHLMATQTLLTIQPQP
jgi:hypothetical protein